MSSGDSRDFDVKIVRKLAMKNVTGGHKKEIDTVKNWFATHNQGKTEDRLEELAKDPAAPVEKYGGRDVVRLTSLEDAKEFIVEHGGELPWGLKDD